METFLAFSGEEFYPQKGLEDLLGCYVGLPEAVYAARHAMDKLDSVQTWAQIWVVRGLIPELVLDILDKVGVGPVEEWSPNWKDIGTADYSRPEVCVGPV